MKIAIMQPYFFPYLGYFQLIKAVDKFIFFDDVNYINGGWINRNRIVINGQVHYVTLHLQEASQNKLINSILIDDNRAKLKRSIELSYKKSPNFKSFWPVVDSVLSFDAKTASELIIRSVTCVCDYLEIKTVFEVSGQAYAHTKGLGRVDRIIAICQQNKATTYINAIGGMSLYDKNNFEPHKVFLKFIKPDLFIYKNGAREFVPWLSIIDLLMWNSHDEVKDYLDRYTLL